MEASILVVDDETMTRVAISSYLKKQGYRVYPAETGAIALQIFEQEKIDFIILDLMLPDISGEQVCKRIRETSNVPIIMLTAKVQEEDLLNGLGIGADDYMTKPFSLKELALRIQVILRRVRPAPGRDVDQIETQDQQLLIDFSLSQVKKNGSVIPLTKSEWKIVEALFRHPGKVFSRDMLIEIVFGTDFDGYDRVIDTHVKNLRKKLEKDSKNPEYIITVHGIGYRAGGVCG